MEVMTDYLQTEGGMTVTELEAAKRYFGSLTDPWNKNCKVKKRWTLGTEGRESPYFREIQVLVGEERVEYYNLARWHKNQQIQTKTSKH